MAPIDMFHPEKRTLGEILSSTSPPIRVPDFQRDFSWESQQVAEFWSDLVSFAGLAPVNLTGREYFLGAAVLVNNGTFHLLLDGQQRIATSTILLAVLRDRVSTFSENASRQIQDRFIEFDDFLTGGRTSKIQLNTFDRAFFRDFVQSFPRVAGTLPSKKSHELISAAYTYFQARVGEGWQAAGGGKNGFEWAAHVAKALLDHVAIVTVTSNNEKSASSIFATLNDRGIGLSSVDLIRSLVLQRAHETQREEILQCWDTTFEACGTGIAAETLIRMSWVSEHGDIKARALYKVISEQLEGGASELDYSRTLRDDAVFYRTVRDGDTDDNTFQELWPALRTLRATAGYALLLAAKRRLTTEEQKRLTKALVSLAIRHNVICDRDRANFETTVYRASKLVSEGGGVEAALDTLRSISPSDNVFQTSFSSLSFTPSEHGVARYLLRSIEGHVSPTAEVAVAGPSRVHVEHIYPQRPANEHKWQSHKEFVGRLGNLTLLDKRLNEAIKNATFADKKQQAYGTSRLEITRGLLQYPDDWSPELVTDRQLNMMASAEALWPHSLV